MSFETQTQLQWNGPQVMRNFDNARIRSLFEAASLVEGRAVLRAPVDLGNLRGSITFSVSGQPTVFQQLVEDMGGRMLGAGTTITAPEGTAVVGTAVFYAVYQEFGTRFQRAQPFLLPALRESMDDVIEIFRRNGVRIQQVMR